MFYFQKFEILTKFILLLLLYPCIFCPIETCLAATILMEISDRISAGIERSHDFRKSTDVAIINPQKGEKIKCSHPMSNFASSGTSHLGNMPKSCSLLHRPL